MQHYQLLELPSVFSQAAIALDAHEDDHTGEVAVARCTLTELLSNDEWKSPLLVPENRIVLDAAAELVRDHREELANVPNHTLNSEHADAISIIAGHRNDGSYAITRQEAQPVLRELVGTLFDQHRISPEERKLGMHFALALSRAAQACLRARLHERSRDAWIFHQHARGFADPFNPYSNTGRCH